MEDFFTRIPELAVDPAAWAALVTLIVMEVVLGIDNLVFIAILSNKLPENQRKRARRIGLTLALVMRLVLLSMIAFIVGLVAPVFTLLGNEFSWRDLILIGGGLFLIWKATNEIHHSVDTRGIKEEKGQKEIVVRNFAAAIFQIILLDIVFSVDSILTAVGMTNELPIMFAAVIITVALMMVAANPLANFINSNPTIVMLALGFLLMIGAVLIADGLGFHVPKGYIYAAMAFSGLVEGLNMMARKARERKEAAHDEPQIDIMN